MRKIIGIILLFSIQYLHAQNRVVITQRNNQDNSVDIYYNKDMPGTYCIYLNFSKYENTLKPERKFIIDNYSGVLCRLKPIDGNKSITYSYSYIYKQGFPNPKFDSTFVYLLPLKNNNPIEVRYLSNLNAKYFEEEEPKNWKAFQFIRNKADTICSVRKGIVVDIVDKYSVDTTNNYLYSSNRNFIMIEHKDGTYAKYEGLDNKNIFVKLGDVVLPNQPLAKLIQYDKSGNFQLRFSVYYLNEDLLEIENSKKRNIYGYIDPYFQTTEGIVKLASRKTYISNITENLIIKELSKKELKIRQKKQAQLSKP